MKNIKMKIVSSNYKKAFIHLLVVTIIFIVAVVGVGGVVFGNRLKNVYDTIEQNDKEQVNVTSKDENKEKIETDEANSNKIHKDKHKEDKEGKKENRGEKEKFEISDDEIENILQLTMVEKIVIGVCTFIAIVIVIYYWLLVIGLTVKMASNIGANYLLFGGLALLTNVCALIVLLIYKNTSNICEKCGKVQSKKDIFCRSCGNKLGKVCSECGYHADKKDIYCRQCGKKL